MVKIFPTKFQQLLYLLLVGVLLLTIAIHVLVNPIPAQWQYLFFGVLVLSTGIPHGAVDHLVERQTKALLHTKFSAVRFYIAYLLPMVVYGVAWLIFPTLSLYYFLYLSATHFGETDIPLTNQNSHLVHLLQISFGVLMLSTILAFHIPQVTVMLSELQTFHSSLFTVLRWAYLPMVMVALPALVFLLVFTLLFAQKQIPIHVFTRAMLLYVPTSLAAYYLPLLVVFSLYFGLWHSVVSLQNIRIHLSALRAKPITWWQLVIQCIPYTVLAFAGIGGFIWLANIYNSIHTLVLGGFIGIAILTLPHSQVMGSMYERMAK
ncbi:MAG: hypothetical protein EAY68_03695 [Bacteroidetes bacterium]|nr:MAG: hypothetical protein EAY68_03695 [Bacteroidota bacterium]